MRPQPKRGTPPGELIILRPLISAPYPSILSGTRSLSLRQGKQLREACPVPFRLKAHSNNCHSERREVASEAIRLECAPTQKGHSSRSRIQLLKQGTPGTGVALHKGGGYGILAMRGGRGRANGKASEGAGGAVGNGDDVWHRMQRRQREI